MGTKIAQAERNPKFIWGKKRSEEGGNLFPNLLRALFSKQSLGDCRGAAYLNRAARSDSKRSEGKDRQAFHKRMRSVSIFLQ